MKLFELVNKTQEISSIFGNDMDVKIVYEGPQGEEVHDDIVNVGYDENHRELVIVAKIITG